MMMRAVYTSEKSVYSNETTRRYIPEGSNVTLFSHFELKFEIARFSHTSVNHAHYNVVPSHHYDVKV
jgi:hypothetical protein